MICNICAGDGYTVEHLGDENCMKGECPNCPIQVQCIDCQGTGKLINHRA